MRLRSRPGDLNAFIYRTAQLGILVWLGLWRSTLKHMWCDAAERLEFFDSEKMNVYILQVMSILRQAYCSPKYLYFLIPGQVKPIRDPDGTRRKEVLVPNITDFEKRWNQAVAALESAIKLLRHPQEFGAISSRYLPYVSILRCCHGNWLVSAAGGE